MDNWCHHRNDLMNILVVQTSFVRTLADQQKKGPIEYMKMGVDQLGEVAGKVKETVSNAASSAFGGAASESHSSEFDFLHEIVKTSNIL